MKHIENGEEWDCEEYYPSYGVAPHKHDVPLQAISGKPITTELLPRSVWPGYFTEDPDAPGLGTYTCPACYERRGLNEHSI